MIQAASGFETLHLIAIPGRMKDAGRILKFLFRRIVRMRF